MPPRKTAKRLYLIPVLSKALDILELLQGENAPMTLEAIHRQTKISKTTVYRVLKTFVHRGYLSQSPDGQYRHVTRPKKLRFGFAGQSADMPFSVAVTESLKAAAASVGVDLLILDNCYDAITAVKNAEEFVSNEVDLVIEFQVEQDVAPVIGDTLAAAKIPRSPSTSRTRTPRTLASTTTASASSRARRSPITRRADGTARWTGCWVSTCPRRGSWCRAASRARLRPSGAPCRTCPKNASCVWMGAACATAVRSSWRTSHRKWDAPRSPLFGGVV